MYDIRFKYKFLIAYHYFFASVNVYLLYNFPAAQFIGPSRVCFVLKETHRFAFHTDTVFKLLGN